MIKISENTARLFVMLAYYMRDGNGSGLESIFTWVNESWVSKRNRTTQDLKDWGIVRDGPVEMTAKSFVELVKPILVQLRGGPANGESDASLIELIADALGSPNAQNVLCGDTLKHLRDSILLPEERSRLRAEIEAKELRCSGCGDKFEHEQALTYLERGNRPSG